MESTLVRTMDVNLTRIVFVLLSAQVAMIGLLINIGEHYLPTSITRSYRYGKYAAAKDHPIVSKLEVPKRWFKHFYEFAAPASSIVFLHVIWRYVFHNRVPGYLTLILDLQLGSGRKALISPETTLLAIILVTIQCWKRLYETHRVSIFSDGKMNAIHYALGFIHYGGLLICVIGESEGFVGGSSSVVHWDRLTNLQYVCAIIFLMASYEQLRTNYILANLRKDKSGKVVTRSHMMPTGRLFELISAPLQFTEITMYAMLSIIMWESSTYHWVFAWVLANQTETAILTHQWNVSNFPNYPRQRKILVPYLF